MWSVGTDFLAWRLPREKDERPSQVRMKGTERELCRTPTCVMAHSHTGSLRCAGGKVTLRGSLAGDHPAREGWKGFEPHSATSALRPHHHHTVPT